MKSSFALIDGQLRIPELLRQRPQTRAVLDRYGLQGCGGAEGPAETLEFFARAHDVPLTRLLAELREAPDAPASSFQPRSTSADTIYRPFFKSAIALVLTLGAVWGAYLLLRIGFSGSFRSAGLHEVNAHGHAQIFGWVGLFVMGFAYQAFPRFKHTSLAHPRLALVSLGLMLTGIVVRSVCEPLAPGRPWLGPVAVTASALEVLAISLFAGILAVTWRRSKKGLAFHDWYVVAALFWFVVQAVCETVYLAATLAADGREQLLALVATWQAPLRDAQLHGFALLMILGVSQRIFYPFYGLTAPRPAQSLAALVLLNLAVVGEIVSLLLMRLHGRAWAPLWYGAVLLLAGTVVVLVRGWRIYSRAADPDRSLKFLRAAYGWLFVSLALLVLLPFYQRGLLPRLAPDSEAAALGFSHAYYGAVRHAITVGFISLMIVGVAAKVVPTLNGQDIHGLPSLWLSFLFLNAGCALRVGGQVLTDFTPSAFPFAGVSGLLEVTGLALWSLHLWAIMNGRVAARGTPSDPLLPGRPIRATHRIGEVLDRYPQLLPTFVAHGFTPLESPLLRRFFVQHTSIARACRVRGVDEGSLLSALNRAAGLLSLPVLTSQSSRERVNVMSPTQILKSEHRVIEQVLDCLEAMTDQACVRGALDGASARDALGFFRHFADGCHHSKEEDYLFPTLETKGFDPLSGPTAVMRGEHHTGRELLHGMEENLGAAAAGDPDALTRFSEHAWAYVRLLREHIQKEDRILFTMADQLLSSEEQKRIEASFAGVEHDSGPGTHEHYLAVAQSLAERFGIQAVAEATSHSCCSHAPE